MAVSECCQCWIGHGDCGGCSGYPGIKHEPACGYEPNPDCPLHGFTIEKDQEIINIIGRELSAQGAAYSRCGATLVLNALRSEGYTIVKLPEQKEITA